MTRVSIASLRVSNPSVGITVVCDAVSGRALRYSADPLLDEVDDIFISDTPDGSPDYRNRHVKTRLREIITGPFLFLDSDTFVRGDLSPIFSLDADIAGARNHSHEEYSKQIWPFDSKTLETMGWRVGEQAYINGGVLFLNETPSAHRFASLWHQKWLQAFDKCAWHRDQAALNSALFEAQPRLEILPHQFNAQFKVAPHVALNAIIWHFYAADRSKASMTALEALIDRVLGGELLCLDTVAQMIECSHPWRRESWMDDWMAKCLAYNGRMDTGYQAWFQGRRTDACRYWTIKALKRHSAGLRRFFKLTLLRSNRSRCR